MDLLFRRAQSNAPLGKVSFKLWSKIELDEEEQALVEKYRISSALLIWAHEPELEKKAQWYAAAVLVAAGYLLFSLGANMGMALFLSSCISATVYYWYKHQYRETLYVYDLIHGKDYACDSVIDLARREAWITTMVGFLRQVVESAKHWDGVERHAIEPLPPDEARQSIIKGI